MGKAGLRLIYIIWLHDEKNPKASKPDEVGSQSCDGGEAEASDWSCAWMQGLFRL